MKELAASSIVLVHNIIYIYIYSIKQYYINYTLQHNTVCIKNYDCKLKVENYPSNSYTRSNKGRHVIYCTPCQA